MRILVARYRSREEFNERYLPAFEQGGVFHPTREQLLVGEQVIVNVRYPALRDKLLIRGMVAWRRAGKRRTQIRAGVGIEFLASERAKRDYLLQVVNGDLDELQGQRRFLRLPTGIPVDWRIPNSTERRLSRLSDIGPGGAFIRTRDTRPPGTPVVIELTPPGSRVPMAIEGRIAWTDDSPASGGFGVQFRWRDAGGLRRLKELVRRLSASDLPATASRS